MGGATRKQEKMILKYGEHLGLVFQLIDDVIDQDGYVQFAGEAECLSRAHEVTRLAKEIASQLPKKNNLLSEIADFVFERRK